MTLRRYPSRCPSCGSVGFLVPRLFDSPYHEILALATVGLAEIDSVHPPDDDGGNHWICKKCNVTAALFGNPESDLAARNKWLDQLIVESSKWSPQEWLEAREIWGFELFILQIRDAGESIEVYGDDLSNLQVYVRLKNGEEIPFPTIAESAQLACAHLQQRLLKLENAGCIPVNQLFNGVEYLSQYTVRPDFDQSRYRMTFKLAE